MFSWRSHVVSTWKRLIYWSSLTVIVANCFCLLWPILWKYLFKHYCSANPSNVPSFYFLREEVNTLSRQASFRRLNSVSTDPRVQVQTHKEHLPAGLQKLPAGPSVAGVEPLANQQPCLLQRLMITCSCSFKQIACGVRALLLRISYSGWYSFFFLLCF